MKNLLFGLFVENPAVEPNGDSTTTTLRQHQSKAENPGNATYRFRRNAERIYKFFDKDWYLATYPDIGRAKVDPLSHYLKHGHREDRDPSPFFSTSFYREYYLSGSEKLCPLVHFAEVGFASGALPHPLVDLSYISQKYDLSATDAYEALLEQTDQFDNLCPWFSKSVYKAMYPDVFERDVDPLRHMTDYGISELRKPHPSYSIFRLDELRSKDLIDKQLALQFSWKGQVLAIVGNVVPAAITAHVLEQGQYDSQVYSPGYQLLGNLTQIRATDLSLRCGFDHHALLREFDGDFDVIVLHPGLTVGGAEKYMAQLINTLQTHLGLRCAVVTTGAERIQDLINLQHHILRPLLQCRVVSAFPYLKTCHSPRTILALLLLALKPKCIFVMNSKLGLDVLSEYGKPLSSVSKLFATFFSEAPFADGSPFSTRYLYDVVPNAKIIADNKAVLKTLNSRIGGQCASQFIHLPQMVELPTTARLKEIIAARRVRKLQSSKPTVLWASRWVVEKGRDILISLAQQRPDLQFEVFGVPIDYTGFPSLPNLTRHDESRHVSTLNLEAYDVFLFTSRFEGFPNVVLEMAARCVPIVASDVGGLREVFSASNVDFVSIALSNQQIVENFSAAIDAALKRSVSQTVRRVEEAYRSVEAIYRQEAFTARVREIVFSEEIA